MGASDAGIVLTSLWVLLAHAVARADPPSPAARGPGDTVVTLPEVWVDERRPVTAARRLPTAFVAELHTGASQSALELLPELLSQIPGVHVQQYGGLGAFSVMSVRGASPGQVAFFLDGSPLTSASHAVVSLADLPITAVERVEVYRGASPLTLGLAGAGGAVNLVTAGGARLPELRIVRGSFDTWEGRGSASATRAPWSGLVHLGYQGSTGDFRYHDDNGTPFNASDDSSSARLNNRFDALTGLARLHWHPRGPVRVTARGELFEKRQGLPGLGVVPARHAGLAFGRGLGQLELSVSAAARWAPRATLRGGLTRERTRFRDPYAELGLGTHDTDDRVFDDHLDLELAWEDLPGSLALQTGGTLRREQARPFDRADALPEPPPSRRGSRGALLGLQIRPLGGRLVLHAAQRWDVLEDRRRAVGPGGVPQESDARHVLRAPQLGARVGVGLGLELKANWSEAERPPDFLELFGNQGSLLGNPALEPERVESWDAGASWTPRLPAPLSVSLTWAHFESGAEDLILYLRNSQSSVRAQNVSAAEIRGEELALRVAGRGLSLAGSFTWQTALDAGDVPYWTGKRLPQRPGREGYARLAWTRGALGLSTEVHYLADNYLDRYNSYRIASRTLLGASLSVHPSGWPLRLIVEGKNLGDRQAADVAGFPLPGRSVFLACESRLGPHLP